MSSSTYTPSVQKCVDTDMPSFSADDKLELILHEDDNKELSVHKCALCLTSSVFRDMLSTEPSLRSVKVEGSEETWLSILARIYHNALFALTPEQVLDIVPIAHLFNFEVMLRECTAAASGVYYDAQGITFQDPFPFLEAAERCQIPELASAPFKSIIYCIKVAGSTSNAMKHIRSKVPALGPFYRAALTNV